MNKGVLALGPFVGSFEHEIVTFRPYMRWIEKNIGMDKVYMSSHFNRKFLYPQIPPRRYFPIFKQFSRQEIHQDGYSHRDIDQKDFTVLVRAFKDKIVEQTKLIKKDIDLQALPYVKYIPPVSIYHKIFEPIKVPINKRKGNVVYIPDISMSESDALKIYDFLSDRCNFSVIGDMKCHLPEANEVLQALDYYQNGYMKIITAITNSRAVITPCSHWALIANLQGVPVISWGDTVGQYKPGGIYHFGNYQSQTVYYDDDSNPDNLIKSIDGYLKGKV